MSPPEPDAAASPPGPEASHRVFNRRQQPVELHLDEQVILLPAGGSVDVRLAGDLPAQLVELERGLLVDVQALPGDEEEPPGPEEREGARAPRPRRGQRRGEGSASGEE